MENHPIMEEEFLTESEACAWAISIEKQGYIAQVYQSVYDYAWCVDVYIQQQGERAA